MAGPEQNECSDAVAGKIKTEAFRQERDFESVINIVGGGPRLIAMCQISKYRTEAEMVSHLNYRPGVLRVERERDVIIEM